MSEPTPTAKTCESCRHWHRVPRQTKLLDEPVMGECRGVPPDQIVLPGQAGLAITARYRALPPEFPACGLHAEEQK